MTVFSPNSGIKKWVSSTQEFGQWVYLETTDKGEIKTIAKQSQYHLKSISLDSDCQEKTREFSELVPKDIINDKSIAELAKKKSKFLLVLWSPEMVYTGPALTEVRKIEKEISVEYFLEGSAPLAQAKLLQQKFNLPGASLRQLKSFEFTVRQARAHLPVMYLFKDGKIQGFGWRGYRSASEIKKLLAGN